MCHLMTAKLADIVASANHSDDYNVNVVVEPEFRHLQIGSPPGHADNKNNIDATFALFHRIGALEK